MLVCCPPPLPSLPSSLRHTRLSPASHSASAAFLVCSASSWAPRFRWHHPPPPHAVSACVSRAGSVVIALIGLATLLCRFSISRAVSVNSHFGRARGFCVPVYQRGARPPVTPLRHSGWARGGKVRSSLLRPTCTCSDAHTHTHTPGLTLLVLLSLLFCALCLAPDTRSRLPPDDALRRDSSSARLNRQFAPLRVGQKTGRRQGGSGAYRQTRRRHVCAFLQCAWWASH